MEFTKFHILYFSFLVMVFSITTKTLVFAAKECDFPAIFNFGDSNSDTGNMVGSGLLILNPPYGETFFHKPSGRACDGRLLIDFVAESFGLPFINGYLDVGNNLSHGANFAAVGAPIRDISSPIIISPFYFGAQYNQFQNLISTTQLSNRQGNIFASLMPKEKYFSEGLYLFDIGSNDLLSIIITGNMTLQEFNTSISDILSTFSNNIKDIYNSGARSFWIQNIGPLGCLPKILTEFPLAERDRYGCVKHSNEVCQYFNQKLREVLVQLRNDLPLAAITHIDIYSIKYSLFQNPEKYGFEQPLVACCGLGEPYNYNDLFPCGETIDVNGTQFSVGSCEKPSTRVNWDGYHYTQEAQKFIFNQISTGIFSDPPIPLSMVCHRDSITIKHSTLGYPSYEDA